LSSTVTAGSGCDWTANTSTSWITLSTPSGTGNGAVSFDVDANTGPSRAGTLTIAGQTVTVTQAGACSFAVSSTSQNSPVNGGPLTTDVTAGTGCAWTATSNDAWITITGGGTGSGNGTVAYTVGANTGTAGRTGTLLIAGQIVTIAQAGSCSFTVSPLTHSPSASSALLASTVTTGSGCSWTVSTTASWITISGTSPRTGSGTLWLNISANTSTPRTGTVSVADQTITVNQAGSCSYSLSPTTQNVPGTGGPFTAAVTTLAGCNWTTNGNASWITVTSGTGTGSGTVAYTVAANSATTARTGTLLIGSQTLTVSQASSCVFTLSPTSHSTSSAATTLTTTVTVNNSACNWNVVSNASWITVSGLPSRTGSGTVSFSVTANTAAGSRTGTLTMAGQTVTVIQGGTGSSQTTDGPSAPSGVRVTIN
jgi:hypothetical protein